MPIITLKFKDNIIGRYPFAEKTSLTIGRRKDNDIVIDNLAVSGHHAKIDMVNEAFVLLDLKSKNGSFVNEQLVDSHWLKHGDVISIGKHQLLFSADNAADLSANGSTEMEKTMIMDTSNYRSMVQKSATRVPKLLLGENSARGYLTFLAGGRGSLELAHALVKIGKDPASDIVVKGFLMGLTAATISRRPDGYYLSFAGGWFRPKVNERVVKKSVMLQDLDVIAIGSVKLQFFLKNYSSPTVR